MEGNKLIQKGVQLSAQIDKLREIPKLARRSKAGKTNSKCEETESFRLRDKL